MVRAMVYPGLTTPQQAMVRHGIKKVDTDTIINSTCLVFNVRRKNLLGNRRHRDLSDARRICYKLIRDTIGLSYPKIGSIFGKKHSTVICALDTFDILYSTDKSFREKVDRIKNLM